MKKYKSFPPYLANGKTTFPNTKEKPGIYQIFEAGKLVYIGMSTKNLYKTMYRHFESWHHRSQPVISYADRMKRNRYTVRVTLCTALQAVKLERLLIKKYKPRDNSQQFDIYDLTPSDIRLHDTFKGETLIDLPDNPTF
jgi:excinuclease UvrABC nuclease subunit